ncbi:taste receptor type 1 member 1 [Tiliqua scincoides]|uniref:taste receptor type 1 member 1 n=1 Tax=Tiliqua scincoides TaxID=71010 RepID=UPI003463534B
MASVRDQNQGFSSPLRLDGDYTIGGLFRIHRSTHTLQKYRPEVDICESSCIWSSHGYHLVQAMRLAVEEINNSSSLLPNITLGYEIYDICSPTANMYGTLSLLSQGGDGCIGSQHFTVAASYMHYLPKAMAVIGPDSSEDALVTASLLSILSIPEVSYEASSSLLSLKRTYPSFLRTIPSDRTQVEALAKMLQMFKWSWVAVVGSNNTYGRQGLQMLQDVATTAGFCFAFQGVIPTYKGNPELESTVQALKNSTANVVIVFANRQSALLFFMEVVLQNVTGKVWLGTEDWSLASETWQIAGIRAIGTIIGISIKQEQLPGMRAFETAFADLENTTAHLSHGGNSAPFCQHCREKCSQACSQLRSPNILQRQEPSPYDTQGGFNVYTAVYVLAHGLHHLLACQRGVCRKDTVYPWQLLEEVKRVNFRLHHRQIYFDAAGDPLTGYDIVLWNWTGPVWSYIVIGSFDRNPDHLSINKERILWHTEDKQVPASMCSEDCSIGEQKVQEGIHQCCFRCVACSPGTFLNKSNVYTCQKCSADQWAPARSETCFNRTVMFLPWDDVVSVALLAIATLLLALLAGTAALFVRYLETPVVRSAGGWMCFAMLGSLACATCSIYFLFGVPSRLGCVLGAMLYPFSFTICLSCMAARSFQIIIIFKLASRAPGLYEAWRRHHGSGLLIGALTSLQGLMLLFLVTSPVLPCKNYNVSEDVILLECCSDKYILYSLVQVYNGLLGLVCFTVSYLGKDLPNSYNEAKCITFSIVVYFTSFIFYLTTRTIYQGKYLLAIYTISILSVVAGTFGSYFAPKAYVILFHAERNTNEHFQMSIQSYTQRIDAAD